VESMSKKISASHRTGVPPLSNSFWCHLLWMAIEINVQIEVWIHFRYKIHADCQTGGRAPRDTTGLLETLVKKLGVEFRLCRGLCTCTLFLFSPCLYAFTSGPDEKFFGGRMKKCSGLVTVRHHFPYTGHLNFNLSWISVEYFTI